MSQQSRDMSKRPAILTDITPTYATVQLLPDDRDAMWDAIEDMSGPDQVAYVPAGAKDGDRIYLSDCEVIQDVSAELT